MLIEHRMYTLKTGCMELFWQAQHDRGFELVKPILDRLIGYFSTATGPDNQIVHLYRYDSYDDWQERLQGLYGIAALEAFQGCPAVDRRSGKQVSCARTID